MRTRYGTEADLLAEAARLANQAAGTVVAQYGNRLTPEQLQGIRADFEAAVAA